MGFPRAFRYESETPLQAGFKNVAHWKLDYPPANLAATPLPQPAGADSAATGEHTPHDFSSQDADGLRTLTADDRRDALAGVVIGGRYTLQEKIGKEAWARYGSPSRPSL